MLIPSFYTKTPFKLYRQKGAGLIEVLVCIVLMSFGLLGIAGLYNYTIAANKSASSRLAAAMLVADFAEVVRANQDGFIAGSYANSIGTYDPSAFTVSSVPNADLCTFPNCTRATIARQDIALMKSRVRAYLPAGDFELQRVGTSNQLDIWIVWVEGKGIAGDESNFDSCPATLRAQSPAPSPFPRCMFSRVSV